MKVSEMIDAYVREHILPNAIKMTEERFQLLDGMKRRHSLFYGREAESIPWIWREVIPWRWHYGLPNEDGVLRCGVVDEFVSKCLEHVYEFDLRTEMLDPEWPSAWWEREEDIRNGF